MSNILVTGGAGYIGSHTVISLLASGYNVVVFDSLECGHQFTVDTLEKISADFGSFKFVQGDLQEFTDIDAVISHFNIDAVVHFASYIRVEESVINPSKYYLNNVGGTLNLLSAMQNHNVGKIVFSSSAAVYGAPSSSAPLSEDAELRPINPYGKSKLMVEQVLQDFDSAYGLKSVALRYFNVAGADSLARIGEWHEPESHLIPNIINSYADHRFKMFGTDFDTRDGTCVRDYVNVEDLAAAHVLALHYLENGGASDCFNIGTNCGSTVKEVLAACEHVLNRKIDVEICGRRAGDPAFLVASNLKAKKILGWEPKKSLEDSICTAYAWHKFLALR